jgi:hypothetical protein
MQHGIVPLFNGLGVKDLGKQPLQEENSKEDASEPTTAVTNGVHKHIADFVHNGSDAVHANGGPKLGL